MKIEDTFSPYTAQLAMPSKGNPLKLISEGYLAYANMRDEDELKAINVDQIKSRVKDDRALADFAQSGKTLKQYISDGGGFSTPGAAMDAESIEKNRIMQQMAEGRYAMALKKASATKAHAPQRRANKRQEGFTPVSNLDAYNSGVASGTQAVPKTIIKRGKDKATGRTVVQYSDGSVAYAD